MEYSRRIWLGLVLSTLTGMLAACGGGGGGGNSPGGNVSGGFTLSTTSLSFSGKRLGPTPAAQSITAHLTGTGASKIGAAYANGVSPASWLTVTVAGSGADYTFSLSINNTALTAGTYTTTLTFGTADANNNILQTQPVQVSYNLRDGLVISATSVATSLVSGDSFSSESLPFTVSGAATLQWTAKSDSPWLIAPSGTQPGPGNFNVAINMAGYGPGTYNGILTITDTADATDTATLPVTITMLPAAFTASPSQIVLGGASGLDQSAQSLSFSLNTNQNAYAWTITPTTTTGGNWLNVSASSGTVSGSNATVNINATVGQLAAGSYMGQLALKATINGAVVTQNVPVTLNIEPNRVLVNAIGVAFSSFPSRQVLTRSLSVSDTWGVPGVHWQTQSDQTWLTATTSGTTGAPLTLTASPTGLAPGQYTAHLTVSSPDTGVSNQEIVRVGLTVGGTDPTAQIDLTGVAANVSVASPVEPVVFVTSGAASAPIYVYDVNTGTLLRTLNSNFTQPAALAISGDGQTLYVSDNAASGWVIQVLDATSGALQTSYPLTGLFLSSGAQLGPQIAYARPDTHSVLLSPWSANAFDLTTGATYSLVSMVNGSSGVGGAVITVSPDQSTVYGISTGVDPANVGAYGIVYSSLPGVGLIVTPKANNSGISPSRGNGQDIAVSPDGTRVYVAAGAPYEFDVLDGTTLVQQSALAGAPYPSNVETSWNGLVAGGTQNGQSTSGNIWVYDSAGNLLSQLYSDSPSGANSNILEPRTLLFSGDGARLASTSFFGLRFQAAPAPPP